VDVEPEVGSRVSAPVIGTVTVPPLKRIVYFAGLGALAVFGVIDWPIALVIGAGHLLADQHWSTVAQGLGEAVEQV
jgi:hypothetical protein